MGCHTWFYRKIEVSYEETKTSLVKSLTENIKVCQEWIDNPNGKDYLEIKDFYPEWTIGFLWEQVDIDKRKLSIIEKGLCKEAVMNKYNSGLGVTRYIKGKGHYQSLDFCDIFRIGNYPEDILFSFDETMDFIERNKENIYHYYYNEVQKKDYVQQLKDYWNEYPDGMIIFG